MGQGITRLTACMSGCFQVDSSVHFQDRTSHPKAPSSSDAHVAWQPSKPARQSLRHALLRLGPCSGRRLPESFTVCMLLLSTSPGRF